MVESQVTESHTAEKHPPIRIALIGAGIYARDAHVPALRNLADRFEITAVYSRQQANAQALAEQIDHPVDATDSLPALLDRDDIEAVDVLVPIHAMPDTVDKALAAGKHVISEKPIAPTVARGRESLMSYWARYVDQVWMVAENWRYDPAFMRAAQIIESGGIGKPLVCHWALHINFGPGGSKYYSTPWRRTKSHPGGLLLDGGVHHIAALRLVLGEIAEVSAVTGAMREDLPFYDTISATLCFENGVIGSYSVTYATGSPWASALHVVGEEGAVWVRRGAVVVARGTDRDRIDLSPHQGVENEFAAFASAIRDGTPHRNTPDEALRDVAVLEALLAAAESGGRVSPAQVQD